ncbi:uncharacterized protein LOC113201704 isoform X1 [Frankliniella occidentalis]|uniref:Uncharacterized protein LOC113201704 isoform X1 n=1 Tax=Frankliniella occidentalis TaxID=133901 RepID=A0A9C6XAT6_FRAOC|nr:uncharacterized protein LOC113201704 isoform X1 [Frankliniella occidentalis]
MNKSDAFSKSTTSSEQQPVTSDKETSANDAAPSSVTSPRSAKAATAAAARAPERSEYSTPPRVFETTTELTTSPSKAEKGTQDSSPPPPTAGNDPFRDLVDLALASCRDRPRPPGALPWRASGEVVELAGDTAFVGRFWIDASLKTDAERGSCWLSKTSDTTADEVSGTPPPSGRETRTVTIVYNNNAIRTGAEVHAPRVQVPDSVLTGNSLIAKNAQGPAFVGNEECAKSPENVTISDKTETLENIEILGNASIPEQIPISDNTSILETVPAPELGQIPETVQSPDRVSGMKKVQVPNMAEEVMDIPFSETGLDVGGAVPQLVPQAVQVSAKQSENMASDQSECPETPQGADSHPAVTLLEAESHPTVTFQGRKYFLEEKSSPPFLTDSGWDVLVQDEDVKLQEVEFAKGLKDRVGEEKERPRQEARGVCVRLVGAAGDRLKDTSKCALQHTATLAAAPMGDSLAEVLSTAPSLGPVKATVAEQVASAAATIAASVSAAVQADSPCPRCGRKAGRAGAPGWCPTRTLRPAAKPEAVFTPAAAPSSCFQRRKQYEATLETRRQPHPPHSVAGPNKLVEDLLILQRLTQTLRTRNSSTPDGVKGLEGLRGLEGIEGFEGLEGLEGLGGMEDVINAMLAALPVGEAEAGVAGEGRVADRRELRGKSTAAARNLRAPRGKVLWPKPSWDPSPQGPAQRFELRPNRSQLRKRPKRYGVCRLTRLSCVAGRHLTSTLRVLPYRTGTRGARWLWLRRRLGPTQLRRAEAEGARRRAPPSTARCAGRGGRSTCSRPAGWRSPSGTSSWRTSLATVSATGYGHRGQDRDGTGCVLYLPSATDSSGPSPKGSASSTPRPRPSEEPAGEAQVWGPGSALTSAPALQQDAGGGTRVYIHVVGGDADKIAGILSSALTASPASSAAVTATSTSTGESAAHATTTCSISRLPGLQWRPPRPGVGPADVVLEPAYSWPRLLPPHPPGPLPCWSLPSRLPWRSTGGSTSRASRLRAPPSTREAGPSI